MIFEFLAGNEMDFRQGLAGRIENGLFGMGHFSEK